MHMFRKSAAAALILTWILSGCSAFQKTAEQESPEVAETPAQAVPEEPAEQEPAAEPQPAPPRERLFKVDGQASLVEIFVYREGRLAHLGHNHIISSKSLQGTVTVAPKIEDSSLDLQLPVASLIVDDPALRKAAGKDFQTPLSESDIEGTRNNMLGVKVLEAKKFPTVQVHARVAGGTLPVLKLDADVRVLGISNSLRVPVKVEIGDDRLTASGIFDVHQTKLGITPFTTLVGALKVKDKLTVRFHIVARDTAVP